MHVCVIGGGLAGSLLAWRLSQRPGVEVDLLLGRHGHQDATSASGGAVRAYEPLAAQRELAVASMLELLSSDVLRRWADYLQTGSAYLHATGEEPDLPAAAAEIERELPGSVLVAASDTLTGDLSWASGLLPPRTAVVERQAGHLSPGRLRDAIVADLAGRPRTSVRAAALERLDGTRCVIDGSARAYDLVVLAAGAWTPELLRRNALPAGEYRTKAIQYSIYELGGRRPRQFVDEPTGLFARPAAGGGLLLGVPTTGWGVAPGRLPVERIWYDRAADLAARLLPGVRLGAALSRVSAADCYCDPPILALRPVAGAPSGLLTFTGGSGGSVKTVLAASRRAADQIIRSAPIVLDEV